MQLRFEGTTINIMFNQWFSSIGNIMNDIRYRMKNEQNIDVNIVATSKRPDHVYKVNADKFIVEDWKNDIEYMDFMLKTLNDEAIDFFFCKKKADLILKNIDRIEDNTVAKVMYESEDVVNLTSNKNDIYKKLKESNNKILKGIVPKYWSNLSLDEAKKLIEESDNNLCLKLTNDEGGFSFRQIINGKSGIASLNEYWVNKLRKEEAIELAEQLNEEGNIDKIMIMEMLDSPEISIDCYEGKSGFIGIARLKDGRAQQIFKNKELNELCKQIKEEFGLNYIFNVQFRLDRNRDKSKPATIDDLRLIDLNTRASGGMYEEVAIGINLMYYEICDTLNKNYSLEKYDKLGDYNSETSKEVTHIERAVILK